MTNSLFQDKILFRKDFLERGFVRMKKQKNNLKKKYYLAMLGVCASLSVAGCAKKELSEYANVNYNVENYKETKLNYKDVYNLQIQVYNIAGETRMYLIYISDTLDYDVLTGLAIPNDTLVYRTSIVNYLLFYEKVQKKYTLYELEDILEKVKNDYMLNEEQKLVLKK